jgi:hypothetical protein
MAITMPGVTNRNEAYEGFVISWQEPPQTSAKWSANVATDSFQLLQLMGGNGSKVIDAHTREEMIADAKQYIDNLLGRARSGVKTTVRDLFLEALSKKVSGVPRHEIREHLINRGHDLGHAEIIAVGNDDKYELTFQSGDKISFDGNDYHFVRS